MAFLVRRLPLQKDSFRNAKADLDREHAEDLAVRHKL